MQRQVTVSACVASGCSVLVAQPSTLLYLVVCASHVSALVHVVREALLSSMV